MKFLKYILDKVVFRKAGQDAEKQFIDNIESELSFKKASNPDKTKIAVVRLDNIGDFVLWLNGALAIRKRYPNPEYQITLIAPAIWSDFAFASQIFDKIFVIDRPLFETDEFYRKQIYSRLAAEEFGVAINPTFSRVLTVDDVITRATLAPIRIGNKGDDSNTPSEQKIIADRWYTHLVEVSPKAIHELEKNREFAVFFDESSQATIPELPRAMTSWPTSMVHEDKYYILFIGASWISKTWALENFAEIARKLFHRTKWKGIICGSPTDRHQAEKLYHLIPECLIQNLAGQTSLSELAGLISKAALVITNDTSAVHIAAAARVNVVCIAGGGHFGRFIPYPEEKDSSIITVSHRLSCYNCNWVCTHAAFKQDESLPCIRAVTIASVWEAVSKIISQTDN